MTIPAKGFLVIYPGISPSENTDSEVFGISRKGESLYLSRESDNIEICDCVYVPELSYNTCYGRTIDGGNTWEIMTASVGTSNNTASILPKVKLSPPQFSKQSGFYESSFSLKLTANRGETIYYTLDGSEPTINSLKYEKEIEITDASLCENLLSARTDLCPYDDYTPDYNVDKATVIRAIVYNETHNTISDIATEIYFLGYENRPEYQDFPIISLVTDPDNLFDYETGIYTNGIRLDDYNEQCMKYLGETASEYTDENDITYYRYEASNAFKDGKRWEREATLSYFNENHEFYFKQDVGIRIAGASSRSAPQKSFNIYGRDIYDEISIFPYNFFPNVESSNIKLRNGGSLNSDIKITDAFLESLVEDRNIATQRSTPCIVFLNGEYWGIYNIRQRYKAEYISSYYGIDKHNIWMIDDTSAKIGSSEAQTTYNDYIKMATESDLSNAKIYNKVSSFIDIQSFIDFCCINLYTSNTDMDEGHNTALWRSIENDDTPFGDTKWRWMIFDLDQTLHLHDTETTPTDWLQNSILMQDPILQNYLTNEQFRKQFCISFMDIANVNFNFEKVKKELAIWKNTYSEQLLLDHKRFFESTLTNAKLEEKFSKIETYFYEQFDFSMKALQDTFQLKGKLLPITIKVNIPEGGNIQLNTSTLKNISSFDGRYFSDFKIQLTALEQDGYHFLGWSGDLSSTEPHIEFSLTGNGIHLQANYEKLK